MHHTQDQQDIQSLGNTVGMEGEDDATLGLSLGRRSQHHAMGKISELAMGWFGGGGIKLQCQTWFANMAAPRASQKVQKWVQHYMEQLWFGGCMEEKQWGKWNRYAQRDGTDTCTVRDERWKPCEVLTSHKSQGKDYACQRATKTKHVYTWLFQWVQTL